MNDYIKRSDAIKALEREKSDWNNDYKVIDNCIGRLNEVKSADRPRAEWIEQLENWHGFWVGRCSRCSAISRVTNYCANCGARMKGADDEYRLNSYMVCRTYSRIFDWLSDGKE